MFSRCLWVGELPEPLPPRDVLVGKGDAVTRNDIAKLPDDRYGLVMVFRTFDRASFALVMQAATIFWCRSKAASSTSTVAVQFPHVHTNLICTSWKASGEETCPFSIQDSMKYQVLGNRTINGDTALA